MRRSTIDNPEPPLPRKRLPFLVLGLPIRIFIIPQQFPQFFPSPSKPDRRVHLAHGQLFQPEDGFGDVFVPPEDVA